MEKVIIPEAVAAEPRQNAMCLRRREMLAPTMEAGGTMRHARVNTNKQNLTEGVTHVAPPTSNERQF